MKKTNTNFTRSTGGGADKAFQDVPPIVVPIPKVAKVAKAAKKKLPVEKNPDGVQGVVKIPKGPNGRTM